MYIRAGLKNIPTVFLMTDAQVAEEKFLVLINDMLASGEINGLFTDDENADILASVKNEVRAQGIEDTKENCWKYFIDKVRRNLKVRFICFFKIGDDFIDRLSCAFLLSVQLYVFELDDFLPWLIARISIGKLPKFIKEM